jgi:hypothetical protein
LDADEGRAFGLADVVQPVRVDQTDEVILRIFEDGTEESVAGRHVASPSFSSR